MSCRRVGLGLCVVVMVALSAMITSCGAPRRLVSITIVPNGLTINGEGLIVNFKAEGNYQNPVETRDITNSVAWASAAPQIISVDPSTGVAVSGFGCGSNITITATHFANQQAQTGAAVVGTAGVNVTQPSGVCQ
jgi:hypothetical protein